VSLRREWRSEGGTLRSTWRASDPVAELDKVNRELWRELEEEAAHERQGKREDQVAFSALALMMCILLAVGVPVGVWLWRVVR